MNRQHRALAGGRWIKLSFLDQMANIGSEVERAINWRVKDNMPYSLKAFERALELLDLTIEAAKGSRLRELARVREVMLDYFLGSNIYLSTDGSWQSYFAHFSHAARKGY